ncbi:isoprenylcysteine carboxyl methyltransferase family protein [Caviibacter abscessus]|uniref:isoprenylcysteine carboxyl methyltransferase family protein n=1 Tax=Caviibacter abscessus TaxID=1766719 RepID=UPI00082EED91|nr:isoprenylcysteine carboxyl methyltransferase family protein [Caviibacter abscessus]
MPYYLASIIVVLVFIIRLYFLKISIKNEKKILEDSGIEYGKENTKRITILHILFYLFCFIESLVKKRPFDGISIVGLLLIIFALFMLYTVTRLLKDIWTVKLMILKDHKYVNHWLFRNVKHPNYYLNVFPELIGIALLCHAIYTAVIIFPLYIVVMYIRIKEEEKLIKDVIIPNGIRD